MEGDYGRMNLVQLGVVEKMRLFANGAFLGSESTDLVSRVISSVSDCPGCVICSGSDGLFILLGWLGI